MAGDKLQKNTLESGEYWKDKTRETLGENVASLIVNTAITIAAEGMSGTVGMVDTASDLLAALVICATGDSYCTQAKSDLNKVNDKIGGAFDAVMSGDAWESASKTITAANNGDQKAQENVAALLASILAPSKIASSIGKPGKLGSTGNKVDDVAGIEKGTVTEIKTGQAAELDEFNKLNQVDIHAGKIKPTEASAAVEIQGSLGGALKRIDSLDSSADFIFTSGPNKGKTVDFMFTTSNGTAKEINAMNQFFDNNWNSNIKTLSDHLNKADLIPLDFRNLNQANQQKLMNHIKTLPTSEQQKIIIMR